MVVSRAAARPGAPASGAEDPRPEPTRDATEARRTNGGDVGREIERPTALVTEPEPAAAA